jgi:hypothetical protein
MLGSTGPDSTSFSSSNQWLLRFLTLDRVVPRLFLLAFTLTIVLIAHRRERVRGDDDRCGSGDENLIPRSGPRHLVERKKSSVNGGMRRIEDVTCSE